MNQNELNRAVARTTGESVRAIAKMGFVPLTVSPVEREPLVVDWDELEARHVGVFPQHRHRELAVTESA